MIVAQGECSKRSGLSGDNDRRDSSQSLECSRSSDDWSRSDKSFYAKEPSSPT